MQGGLQPTRIPMQPDSCLTVFFGKIVGSGFTIGCDFAVALSGRMNLNLRRGRQIKSPEWKIHVVAAKITERPTSVYPKIPPGHWREQIVVWSVRCRTQPFLP